MFSNYHVHLDKPLFRGAEGTGLFSNLKLQKVKLQKRKYNLAIKVLLFQIEI
jgi:hypothetical protein